MKSDDAKIENYVTNKTMDGLYKMIAAEEENDPAGSRWVRARPSEEGVCEVNGGYLV